jgi:acyl-homoserine lactone acylase PvdQ
MWYLTTMRWNVKDQITQIESRTEIVAASLVGSVILSHGRSPLAAWGVTAINPDITDVYVETISEDGAHYMSNSNEFKPVKSVTETIKVRFSSDINLDIFYTENGVILQPDLLHGSAGDVMPWVSSNLLHEAPGPNQVYCLEMVYDPLLDMRWEGHQDFKFSLTWDRATMNKAITGEEWAQKMRHGYHSPLNHIFVIKNTNEIGYVATGKFPKRKHNIG